MRLHDAVGKLRARAAIADVRARSGPGLVGQHIRWEALFTNSQPLVAAFLKRDDDDWLGWQYQGGQWRVAVITPRHHGKTDSLRSQRHAYVAERYADWFDLVPIPRLTGRAVDTVPPTELAGGYLGYNPDFVYRYRKLPGLTRRELVALSQHYLGAAAEWAD